MMIGVGLLAVPLVTYRANRIVAGDTRSVMEALPLVGAVGLIVALVAIAGIAVLVRQPPLRLAAAAIGMALLFPAIGWAASYLTPPGNTFARVSPAAGFWLIGLALALLLADCLTRLRFGPWERLASLALAFALLAVLLASGSWNDVSLVREYAGRAESFWREGRQHLFLALGSLSAAILIGFPLGVLCHRARILKGATLQVLNIIQTIPSIALFGILMVPLGYLAAVSPLAHALGIRGIGAAPALVALFLYSLLPVVANTVVGLDQVAAPVVDAARGMGLSRRQQLFQVKLPLAFPIILTGIRIVLVQNLGLATVAALIGGGGLGTFIFQGIGQTAMDLVLLGAIPIVAMAFAAAVVLDAVVDLASGVRP
ncbi:ABC transporter permease [Microvirga antarctica]|uniref:ABC transporter permease n=1 Tax=Microvirga antarctica TaxID=2819233 RepID=UPI001B303C4D|nr:ABC transporter permease [Microvirga antarctica]